MANATARRTASFPVKRRRFTTQVHAPFAAHELADRLDLDWRFMHE
jgi:hypothetical protein